jgi:hypothetical protein
MVAAVAIGSAPGIIRSLNARLQVLTSVSGGIMLCVGAIMVLGIYQQLFARIVALAPWVPWEPAL